MTVILSKWQKQHLLTDVCMCTDSRYWTQEHQKPLQTAQLWGDLFRMDTGLAEIYFNPLCVSTGPWCMYTSRPSIIGSSVFHNVQKEEGSFYSTSVCLYRRQCPPYFTVGVDVFIIGDSVSHNVCKYSTLLHTARISRSLLCFPGCSFLRRC